MTSEMLVLVDENDTQIGVAEKMQVHKQGLLHRAFSVFIIRPNASDSNEHEILLQQRNINKYHCGGLWTNTCCSHPREHETIVAAAERRLQEEMGLQLELQTIGNFIYRAEFNNGLIEHEYDYVLLGLYNNSNFAINIAEVQDYKWIAFSVLQLELEVKPWLYTPWLLPALNILRQHMDLI